MLVLVDDEEQRLIEACASSRCIYLKHMVQFSIETAIRQGELLKIHYENINFKKRTLLLKDTKNKGLDRVIPLSQKAFFILESQPRQFDGQVFPITKRKTDYWWKEALGKTKIKGFRWHDLRRHACSLLFEKGFNVPEVQVFSGHRTSTILLSTYTKLDAEKIARKLMKGGY